MRIHILFDFKSGAYGGGNQFLKALCQFFTDSNYYCNDPNNADVILINSHHQFKDIIIINWDYQKNNTKQP